VGLPASLRVMPPLLSLEALLSKVPFSRLLPDCPMSGICSVQVTVPFSMRFKVIFLLAPPETFPSQVPHVPPAGLRQPISPSPFDDQRVFFRGIILMFGFFSFCDRAFLFPPLIELFSSLFSLSVIIFAKSFFPRTHYELVILSWRLCLDIPPPPPPTSKFCDFFFHLNFFPPVVY